jgi:hypothetical protein
MYRIRNEIAIMIHELKGQELIDALERLAENQFREGYECAMDEVYAPMIPECEFD